MRNLESAFLLRSDVDVGEATESPDGGKVGFLAVVSFPLGRSSFVGRRHGHILNEVGMLKGELPAVRGSTAGDEHASSEAFESAP